MLNFLTGVSNGAETMEALGTIFTQFMTWMGTIVTTITGQPLLMLGIGIWVVGAAIGLARRLIGH